MRSLWLLLLLPSSAVASDRLAETMNDLAQEMPRFSDSPEGIGVGVGVGEPSGIALAYRPHKIHTLAAMAGWSIKDRSFHLHADYLLTLRSTHVPDSSASIDLYAGAGPTLNIGKRTDGPGLGARVPIGVSITFDQPVDVFIEMAPVIGVLPEVELHGNGTIGIRGWFRPKQ